MKDQDKRRGQLIVELEKARERIAELERSAGRDGKPGERVQEREGTHRFIAENVADIIWQVDEGLCFTYISPAIKRLGYEVEEVVGRHLFSFLAPESIRIVEGLRARRMTLLEQGLPGDQSVVELQFIRKDGTMMPAEALVNPCFDEKGRPVSYQGVTRDITQRKRTEEALRESEEKFRSLFEKSVDAILLVDGETFIDCNEAALRLVAASRKEQLIGLRPSDISPERQPDGMFSSEKARELNEITLRQGANRFEWMRRAFDGREFWVEVSQTVIPINGKQILYTVWRDISERKSAAEALKTTTARLLRAGRVSRSGNWELNLDTKMISSSEGARRVYGVEATELPLATVQQIPLPEYRSVLDRSLRALIYERAPYDVKFKVKRPDNGEIVDIHSVAEYDPGRRTVFGVVQDVTQRRRAEEEKARLESQLRQAQKMEAIGQLAGGVAHDFNNILTVIIGFSNLLQMNMGENDPMRAYVDQILTSSEKAATLTQSLLAFSRKQQINLVPQDINGIVKTAGKFLERLLTEDVELEMSLTDKKPIAMADATQIHQVVINLATNARDAMPNGGKLSIETSVAALDHGFIAARGFGRLGLYAMITVSDTGVGMDRSTKEHIFEPFFTTKEVGKGTGLGLSMVYGTVKQHHGYITVDSEPYHGTSFRVYLPLAEMGVKHEVPSQGEFQRGTETVLVAEDDTAVRRLTAEILQSFGYTVVEAGDGEDAIRAFTDNGDRIDLLVLDVVMPKRNGKEVYDEVRRIRPNVKVLFVSGYTGDVVIDKGVHDESVEFISKPVSPHDLLNRVREVLDK